MSSAPVDVVIQNLPNSTEIQWFSTLLCNAYILDRATRALVEPDGGVTLTIDDGALLVIPDAQLTSLGTGGRQFNVPPQQQPGKLKLTWQAYDSSNNVIGSAQSVLNIIRQYL